MLWQAKGTILQLLIRLLLKCSGLSMELPVDSADSSSQHSLEDELVGGSVGVGVKG